MKKGWKKKTSASRLRGGAFMWHSGFFGDSALNSSLWYCVTLRPVISLALAWSDSQIQPAERLTFLPRTDAAIQLRIEVPPDKISCKCGWLVVRGIAGGGGFYNCAIFLNCTCGENGDKLFLRLLSGCFLLCTCRLIKTMKGFLFCLRLIQVLCHP